MNNRKDQILQQYEESLLALYISVMADERETKLAEWEQELLHDPEYKVNQELRNKCHKAIDHAFEKRRRTVILKNAVRVTSRVVIGVSVALFLIIGALFMIPSLRAAAISSLFDISGIFTQVHGDTTPRRITDPQKLAQFSEKDVLHGFTIPRLAAAYKEVNRQDDSDCGVIEFKAEDGRSVAIIIDSFISANLLDAQDEESVQRVTVSGCDGVYIQNHEVTQLSWYDDIHEVLISITTENLGPDRVFQIANQMKYVGADR